AVREIAEVVTLGDGKSVPVTTFLNYFLFPPNMHYSKIEKLSGGEKRRLYLLTVLMKNPNVLILDEPTNDLDILTLNVLEEYLKEFAGSVIIVSHDRFFLDKIVDHLFVFEGDGIIKDFVGSYSDYREYIKEKEKQKRSQERARMQKEMQKAVPVEQPQPNRKRKLSYKEQRELEQIEKDLEVLGQEKKELEEKLSGGEISNKELQEASVRIGEVIALLDEKEMRWLELNDN
ncbi:MAG: ATP-binding cassette domain-containing protein, partial [Bacteroidales bacterium]|nr:ATP-binding cassette domain-containing protein [Bacteroidales bacterium]